MDTFSVDELDDSIFGTDATIDWAEEVDMTQVLNTNTFASADSNASKHTENPAAGTSRGQSRNTNGYGTGSGNRGARENREPRGRFQQNSGRQSRQDTRPLRNQPEINNGYNNNTTNPNASSGRGGRGGGSGSSNTGSGNRGARNQGGRSTSRSGYAPPPPAQQNYSHPPNGMPMGNDSRQHRGPRDRSLSMERSGSIDRSRAWRGSSSNNRSRADKADRWEHDKFDSGTQPHSYQSGSMGRMRERRNSNSQDSAISPVDIEHIGKEGISHVTINRRESNASSRGYMAASYETPRRLGPDHSFEDRGGSEVMRFGKAQQQLLLPALGLSAGLPVRSVSPRSPEDGNAVKVPYRAPHRRRSSVDNNSIINFAVSATSPTIHPISASTGAAPQQHKQEQDNQQEQYEEQQDNQQGQHKKQQEQEQDQPKPDSKEADEDNDTTPEAEWENFVANGGLEIPFDRITDDLLKNMQRTSVSQDKPTLSGIASEITTPLPPVFTPAAASDVSPKQRSRAMVQLDDDNDTSDDDTEHPDTFESHTAQAGPKGGSSPAAANEQSISIRGSAKKTSENPSWASNGMSSLVLDQVVAPRTRRPSIPISERTTRTVPPATSTQPRPLPANTDPLGIRIKGVVSSKARSSTDVRTPSMPIRPTASDLRPATPTKPAVPLTRPSSRSSSNEGRAKAQGPVPSTYLRRQAEVYDEDRGRHIFSASIPYDENRYAPIHVHERDDVAKLAAKFARTWRIHNKEQRVK
ncbi:hypothetical protein GGF37_004842, partial [Kickxella alabastrina]